MGYSEAASNVRKHGVSFDEAGSVLLDQLAVSGPDPDHSVGESRYITFGMSICGRLSQSRTPIALELFASSVHGVSPARKGKSMKKVEDKMRTEYKSIRLRSAGARQILQGRCQGYLCCAARPTAGQGVSYFRGSEQSPARLARAD